MASLSILKKLRQNAIVSSTRKYIKSTDHWCKIYLNDNQQTRLHFKVEWLKQDTPGKNIL